MVIKNIEDEKRKSSYSTKFHENLREQEAIYVVVFFIAFFFASFSSPKNNWHYITLVLFNFGPKLCKKYQFGPKTFKIFTCVGILPLLTVLYISVNLGSK
jgi:hypothetical protein